MAIPKGYRLDVPMHVMPATEAGPLGQIGPPTVGREAEAGRVVRAAGPTPRAA
jgi:hypothetical protein